MPSIGSLILPKPTSATVDFGDGESVTLVFDANAITPAWVSKTQDRVSAEDTLSLPKALADVLLSWDITDDDGAAYPPIAENLAVFSFSVMSLLFETVMANAVPSSAEGNASSDTLPTASMDSTVQPASPQNGAAISGSQSVSPVAPGI